MNPDPLSREMRRRVDAAAQRVIDHMNAELAPLHKNDGRSLRSDQVRAVRSSMARANDDES